MSDRHVVKQNIKINIMTMKVSCNKNLPTIKSKKRKKIKNSIRLFFVLEIIVDSRILFVLMGRQTIVLMNPFLNIRVIQ